MDEEPKQYLFTRSFSTDREKQIKQLLDAAAGWSRGCPGFTEEECKDMAAQLRAEARAAKKDPDYVSTLKPTPAGFVAHPAFVEIKKTVTAETERARSPSPRR